MFDIEEFKELIQQIKKTGKTFSTNWKQKNKNLIFLRHDIDFCLNSALQIAKVEKDLEICSNFFFMMSSNMYNLLSKENLTIVKEIKKMNHKISIHLDYNLFKNHYFLTEEIKLFEKMFQVKVDIISIHRPQDFLKKNNDTINSIAHTYQDAYFKEMEYISDSGGTNPKGKIEDFINKKGSDKNLQLLMHPIWWTKRTNNPTNTLNHFKSNHLEFFTNQISINCKTYEK